LELLDLRRREWDSAYLDTDAAPNAEFLGYFGYFVVGGDLDAELSHADDGTGLFALLPTSLRLALVRVDDGDSGLLVHLLLRPLPDPRHLPDLTLSLPTGC
jgi:hypothetical protein